MNSSSFGEVSSSLGRTFKALDQLVFCCTFSRFRSYSNQLEICTFAHFCTFFGVDSMDFRNPLVSPSIEGGKFCPKWSKIDKKRHFLTELKISEISSVGSETYSFEMKVLTLSFRKIYSKGNFEIHFPHTNINVCGKRMGPNFSIPSPRSEKIFQHWIYRFIRIPRHPRHIFKGNLNGLPELPSDSVPMIDLGNPPRNGYDTGSVGGSRDTQWIRERLAGVQVGVRGRLDAVVVRKRIGHFISGPQRL